MRQKKNHRVGRRKILVTIHPNTGRSIGKNISRRKKQQTSLCQTGGFLNGYDFAYAGRDTVNQFGKIAPKIISQATGKINKIAQQRIDQVIRSGGAEIERVARKIIRGAIEEVYKTPFRLKKQFQKIKIELFKQMSNEKTEPAQSQQFSVKESC